MSASRKNLWGVENGETLFASAIRGFPNNNVTKEEIISALDEPEAKEKLLIPVIIDRDEYSMFGILANKFSPGSDYEEKNTILLEFAKKMLDLQPNLCHVALLHELIQKKHKVAKELLESLHSKGINVHEVNPETGYTSLETACYLDPNENSERDILINKLLEMGANPGRQFEEYNEQEEEEASEKANDQSQERGEENEETGMTREEELSLEEEMMEAESIVRAKETIAGMRAAEARAIEEKFREAEEKTLEAQAKITEAKTSRMEESVLKELMIEATARLLEEREITERIAAAKIIEVEARDNAIEARKRVQEVVEKMNATVTTAEEAEESDEIVAKKDDQSKEKAGEKPVAEKDAGIDEGDEQDEDMQISAEEDTEEDTDTEEEIEAEEEAKEEKTTDEEGQDDIDLPEDEEDEEEEETSEKVTMMHVLARNDDYKTLKIILKHVRETKKQNKEQDDFSSNIKDSNGETPLHYAVKAKNFDIVCLLSRFPDVVDITDWESVVDVKSTKRIKDFVKNKILELRELSTDKPHWVSSLNFKYYRMGEEEIEIEGERNHSVLIADLTRMMSKKEEEENGNYATAGITFLLTKGEETKEVFVPIESRYLHVSQLGDRKEYAEYLESLKLERKKYHIEKSQKPYFSKSSAEIKALYMKGKGPKKEKNPEFSMLFHHSEQALFWGMNRKKALKRIVRDLISGLPGFEKQAYKVVAIVFNIYSQRYMCENCQNVAMSSRLDQFKELLVRRLKKIFKVKNKVPFTLVVSSTQPYAGSEAVDDNVHRMNENDHKEINIDLGALKGKHIFFKDMVSVKPPNHAFSSRKPDEKFRQKNEELKKENEALKGELKGLKSKSTKLKTEPESQESLSGSPSVSGLYDSPDVLLANRRKRKSANAEGSSSGSQLSGLEEQEQATKSGKKAKVASEESMQSTRRVSSRLVAKEKQGYANSASSSTSSSSSSSSSAQSTALTVTQSASRSSSSQPRSNSSARSVSASSNSGSSFFDTLASGRRRQPVAVLPPPANAVNTLPPARLGKSSET